MKLEERKQLKFSGIYIIKNKLNGHSYIGQAKNICSRIWSHLQSTTKKTRSDYQYPLHIAIRKYGQDKFELEVLKKCAIEELNYWEEYFIRFYHTCKMDIAWSGGYNLTFGGNQNIRFVKLTPEEVKEIQEKLLNLSITKTQLCQHYGISRDFLNRINIGDAWHDNSLSYPIRKNKVNVDDSRYKGYCILQLNLKTNEVLRTYSSSRAAARGLNKEANANHIRQVIKGERKTAFGFKWAKKEINKEAWVRLVLSEIIV